MSSTISLFGISPSASISLCEVLTASGVSLLEVLDKVAVSLFAVLASLGFRFREYFATYPFTFLSINRKTAGKYEIHAIETKAVACTRMLASMEITRVDKVD